MINIKKFNNINKMFAFYSKISMIGIFEYHHVLHSASLMVMNESWVRFLATSSIFGLHNECPYHGLRSTSPPQELEFQGPVGPWNSSFSIFLVFMRRFLLFKGDIFVAFSFFIQHYANFKHKDCLLSSKVSIQMSLRAFL